MWDAIFILAALASPLLLLALAAGLAGPTIKIKMRFGIIAVLVVGSALVHIVWEMISVTAQDKTDTRP